MTMSVDEWLAERARRAAPVIMAKEGMSEAEKRAYDAGLRVALTLADAARNDALAASDGVGEFTHINNLFDALTAAVGAHDAVPVDYDTRLDIIKQVMDAIVEHAKEGGSYRTLIYGRLGLNTDAYGYLLASGMTISNEFILPEGRE